MGAAFESKTNRILSPELCGQIVRCRQAGEAANKCPGIVPGSVLRFQFLGSLYLAPAAGLALDQRHDRERPCGQLFTVTREL